MASIVRTARSDADVATVWEVLTRSADWADWSDFSASVREREGTDHPDGVGSIRQAWTAGLVRVREEVTTYEPESGIYEYVLLSGLPLKDYRARIELTGDGDGTTIRWTSTFSPILPLPGADLVNKAAVGLAIGRVVGALAAEAGRRAALASTT